MTVVLVVLAFSFAWSIGSHYTGACMGMPYSLGAVSARTALLLMAPLALVGATFASGKVATTVGRKLVDATPTRLGEVVIVAVAFGVTAIYNRVRIPTSTIQLLVGAVVGVAVGASAGVHWRTIATLVAIWVAAPVVAGFVGFGAGRLFAGVTRVGAALVLVGCLASFAMGANDVALASGALVGPGVLSARTAGLLCGVGLALGVLITGRGLLDRVAFDIVELDRPTATAAQFVQALVVLVAVSFGYFTSMNQALVGAMVGARPSAVHRRTLYGIVRGWLTGPPSSFLLALVAALLVRAAGGVLVR
ncbi:MAG TPA: inorganic phosphate transporter [Acidimicrobiales bacterium]|nr:inorganic phosphate transporter [Acidimicrobiales bacterium]